jgi:hypothetical protein
MDYRRALLMTRKRRGGFFSMTLTKRDLVLRISEETGLNQSQVFDDRVQRRVTPATSMRRLSCQKNQHIVFWLEGATVARREWISLPYELARESGSRLDPMSLRAECDHLVIGLALRRPCRRTVITPRLASIPIFLLKAFLFFVWFSQTLPPGPTLGTLFFLGNLIQLFAQTLPSHSILSVGVCLAMLIL